MIKKLFFVAVILSAAVIWAGCGGLPKSAVAEVNDKVITKEDLDNKIADLKAQYGSQGGFPQQGTAEYTQFEKQVVGELVTEEVIWFEADKMGITVSDDEVNKQINQIKQSAGGDQQFQQALAQQNMSLDHLKDNVRKGLLYQKVFSQVTKNTPQVSDAQAQAYYNQNKSSPQFQKPETRHVRHILVADQATAQKIKDQLDHGADFAALAKQYSTDTSNKDKGGDLGDVPSQNSGFVAEFEQAMDKLGPGQISGPVHTQFGWHIIQVLSISPAGQMTFAEAKDQIKSQLLQNNQQQAFLKWLDGVKKNYTITYADQYNPTISTPAAVPAGTGAAPAAGTGPAPAAGANPAPAATAPSP